MQTSGTFPDLYGRTAVPRPFRQRTIIPHVNQPPRPTVNDPLKPVANVNAQPPGAGKLKKRRQFTQQPPQMTNTFAGLAPLIKHAVGS